mmetsp:Transcript_10144/g.10110  ORF Transcript_10144/g.10110 Transcript_10144/m.10110 type:complete len:104 (-) Transcript_10144:238-549(-)|eukprot:CAMPEP_0170551804 /NCGR_PEP_ID=MMETSP0211-20121228/9803_1 /TAXON_ID=311385 /ORGANISM="Pseudokeronopsis sp., Strain OXSARD2" /LENGTH=103 /DNA_ID=CAMNT_0010859203 /DNA_START=805 /DNA_END=1116 /DNA_ORIENTATION=+
MISSGVGVIVTVIMGFAIQFTKQYKVLFLILAVGNVIQNLANIWIFPKVFDEHPGLLNLSAVMMGAFTLPAFPIGFAYAAHISKPYSEYLSTGVIIIIQQVFG